MSVNKTAIYQAILDANASRYGEDTTEAARPLAVALTICSCGHSMYLHAWDMFAQRWDCSECNCQTKHNPPPKVRDLPIEKGAQEEQDMKAKAKKKETRETVEALLERCERLENRLGQLSAAVTRLEQIVLTINQDACCKYDLFPF